jgi:hypothetical protein
MQHESPLDLPPQHPSDNSQIIQLVQPLPCGTCKEPTTYGLIWPGEDPTSWTLLLTCPACYRAYQADLVRIAQEEAREQAFAHGRVISFLCPPAA